MDMEQLLHENKLPLGELIESDVKPIDNEYIENLLNGLVLKFDEIELVERPKYTADDILGTQEEIHKKLEESVLFRNEALEKLEKRIENVETIINKYKGLFLEEKPRVSKIKENRFYLPVELNNNVNDELKESSVQNSIQLTDEEKLERAKANSNIPKLGYAQKPKKSYLTNINLKKTLENIIYLGFDIKELSDLPGFIEAPQLLVSLSSKMGLKDSFLKYWIPFIRSEASCAILQDAFWWFYLKYFKKDPTLEQDLYKYFSRISDSFVALFMSVDPSIRDRFFNLYSEFLPQAIYLVFYRAFPDSRLQLNDFFKQELCNVVSEWVLGIKPVPEFYLQWKISPDINVITNTDSKVTSTEKIISKISNLEKMLNTLGEDEPHKAAVKFERELTPRTNLGTAASTTSSESTFLLKKKPQSHTIGEGSVIEKYGFNLKGQSILISHYMKMHHLQNREPQGFNMTRSQITQNPPRTAPSYRDVIYESLQRAKSLGDEFKKLQSKNQAEIKRIEKERQKTVEEFLRIKRSNSAKGSPRRNIRNRSHSSGSMRSNESQKQQASKDGESREVAPVVPETENINNASIFASHPTKSEKSVSFSAEVAQKMISQNDLVEEEEEEGEEENEEGEGDDSLI